MKPRAPAPRNAPPAAAGSVRIIAGRWRGTKLPVPVSPGLRPSSDRVRETLFNWLMSKLPDARVLDAFAGSGALGLEALSRGARNGVLIERDAAAERSLAATIERLGAGDIAMLVRADAIEWLQRMPPQAFDVVFLDPPFADGLWARAVAAVQPHLADDAWIHVESPAGAAPDVPAHWLLHREGGTRDVRFALYRNTAQGADTLRGDHNEPASA